MNNNHFVKMCRKSKLQMREIRYFRYLQYFDTEEEKYITYKRVKEYKFNATIPVEGTIRERVTLMMNTNIRKTLENIIL